MSLNSISLAGRKRRELRVLDFDIESRPLSFTGSKYNPNTKEITAIAAQFIGENAMHCWLLGQDEPEAILRGFMSLYNEADVVTGHYIRGFDLPHINASLLEYEMEPLTPILTQDTCNDLKKIHGIQKSQESLAHMLGVQSPKYHPNWREANRLTEAGIAETRMRVTADITQHIALRQKLIERDMLGPMKVWKP